MDKSAIKSKKRTSTVTATQTKNIERQNVGDENVNDKNVSTSKNTGNIEMANTSKMNKDTNRNKTVTKKKEKKKNNPGKNKKSKVKKTKTIENVDDIEHEAPKKVPNEVKQTDDKQEDDKEKGDSNVESKLPVGELESCAAGRLWRLACGTLCAPDADRAWKQIVDNSPPDTKWHSLRNCTAYQAGVWQSLLAKGVDDVMQPAAFKLALVLRHTPSDLSVKLLAELLRLHPQSQDLTSYVLALLTDDEASWCGQCGSGESPAGPAPAPARDLQLFGDCELAVMAASREEYDAHAKLVRAEYSKLSHDNYVELRVKVLNQFVQIPKMYHSPEFECFESAARENIEREICTLREHLLTGRSD